MALVCLTAFPVRVAILGDRKKGMCTAYYPTQRDWMDQSFILTCRLEHFTLGWLLRGPCCWAEAIRGTDVSQNLVAR